jgi:hypothetical protein
LPNVVGNSVIAAQEYHRASKMRVVLRGALLVLFIGCSDPAARVQLAPVSPCGQVTNETALRVVAYTAGGELRRTVPPSEIDAFPADTEQLGVEVIGDSGRLVAVGKTAPLTYGALEDGTDIPIAMAPVDGFCAVGPMTEPRRAPALARAGDLVLVVGGTGSAGEQLASAEVYDPATATFASVSVPPQLMDLENGLAGAVLSELPDGRVALTGTSSHAFAIFDPATRRFSTPSLFDHRAFHGAYAVATDRLLVIGGCAEVVSGTCSGPSLRTGFVYDLTDLAMRERGPALDPAAIAHGARVLPLGVHTDGTPRYLLAGGFGTADSVERFALTDSIAEHIAAPATDAIVLDGGAALSASMTAVATLAPDRTASTTLGAVPWTTPPRLVTLEDGSVLALADVVARYQPRTNTWTALAAPAAFASPSALRLADGSVLVAGSAATADAWLYRPSLIGPNTGSITVVAGDGEAVLTPADAATTARAASQFVMTGTAVALGSRALVGGPRMAQGSISAVVRVTGGGVALIAQQTGPGRYLAGRLVPGEPARIIERAAGSDTILCSGAAITDVDLTVPVTLSISGGTATLSVGATGAATVKATCSVPTAERGSWGLAVIGDGATVEVGPVTVARTR